MTSDKEKNKWDYCHHCKKKLIGEHYVTVGDKYFCDKWCVEDWSEEGEL